MFKNRVLLILGVLSLFTVTIAVSTPRSNAPLAASDFYQRHPGWTWSSREAASDYFQRHPEVSAPGSTLDLTDYANRHPELGVSSDDALAASDYFMRHPELVAPAELASDLTDYFFRLAVLPTGKAMDLTDYFFRHR
jgi:hypothetical protein